MASQVKERMAGDPMRVGFLAAGCPLAGKLVGASCTLLARILCTCTWWKDKRVSTREVKWRVGLKVELVVY